MSDWVRCVNDAGKPEARLGRALRAARKDRGMTLTEVAAAAGLSQPFLSQLELGRSRPSMRSLHRIAVALGTTQQALLAAAADPGDPPVRGADAPDDAVALLAGWLDDAAAADLPAPWAMVLATADADGVPHARTVLVTTVRDGALWFHSSHPTGKTRDLAVNPQATGVFLWPALGRQAVVAGCVTELDRTVTERAFAARPAQLRRLAWTYDELLPTVTGPLSAVAPGAPERAFTTAREDPAPPSWTTFALTVERADFWTSRGPDAPAARTRYGRDGAGWHQATVLP